MHGGICPQVRGRGLLFVGRDSMGAAAALLCYAVCIPLHMSSACASVGPQVDLRTASIRPARPGAWLDALQDSVHAALAESPARVRILTGGYRV